MHGKDFPVYRGGDGISLFVYEGEIRSRIMEMKFFGKKDLCKVFGALMGEALERNLSELDFDEIIAVPASKRSLKERGYNQAELMAEEIGMLLSLPVGKGLARVKETLQQNKLHHDERAENIKGAFGADDTVRGKKILLIDDIYTTGSTINECKKALLSAGAKSVFYLTTAKTELKSEKLR